MTEERKYAVLLATILCARKLAAMESDRPNPVKFTTVDPAIDQVKFTEHTRRKSSP